MENKKTDNKKEWMTSEWMIYQLGKGFCHEPEPTLVRLIESKDELKKDGFEFEKSFKEAVDEFDDLINKYVLDKTDLSHDQIMKRFLMKVAEAIGKHFDKDKVHDTMLEPHYKYVSYLLPLLWIDRTQANEPLTMDYYPFHYQRDIGDFSF